MDILLLLFLILLNGIFAMSEISVISSRSARLEKLANDGSAGARSALRLKNEPSFFLSTVQVGITMVGILSGAIGEAALADPLASWLAGFSPVAPYARTIAVAVVVMALTYFSVVVGELVPKRMGLLAPEKTASIIALPMKYLAIAAKPLVWFLSSSSNVLLRLIARRPSEDPPVTNAEIRLLMKLGAEAGVFHESEQQLVANVLRLDEQSIRAIMTPRQEIYTIDLDKSEEEIRQRLAECPYSRIVVCRSGLDHILGLLRTADLLKSALAGERFEFENMLHPPLFQWEVVTTTQLIENFRKTNLQCALIVDEYGEVQGLVTLTDVLAAIVGQLPSLSGSEKRDIVKRKDGSWLAAGSASIEQLKMELKISEAFPGEKDNFYVTVGGLIIHLLGKIPAETDIVEELGYRFEVVDMDGHRVDKVLVSKIVQ
jgi:putative hemolysin